jgi:hypothetical protein
MGSSPFLNRTQPGQGSLYHSLSFFGKEDAGVLFPAIDMV